MTRETSLWQTVKRELGRFGALERIENRLAPGTPDVVFSLRRPHSSGINFYHCGTGWLELKSLPAWPKRLDTPLRIRGMTRGQVLFMQRWTNAGGLAFLLLQAERDYLLLDLPATIRLFSGRMRRSYMYGVALTGSCNGEHFPTAKILKCLTPWS